MRSLHVLLLIPAISLSACDGVFASYPVSSHSTDRPNSRLMVPESNLLFPTRGHSEKSHYFSRKQLILAHWQDRVVGH